ncbi:MAG: RNA methyltransferase [Candidatus Micrarchaeaceae archaeon]
MKIYVIVVGIEHQINLGYIARIAKNFGCNGIKLVKPKCKIGKDAIKYSKHGVELLKKAKKYNSLKKAIEGTFSIGTSAIKSKANASMGNSYSIKDISKLVNKNKQKNISIVLGRESIGLKTEEIKECDAIVTLELGKGYDTLNISHALAIILFEMIKNFDKTKDEYEYPKDELNRLLLLFKKMTNKSNIRNKKEVRKVFKRIIKRSNPTRKEMQTLAIAFAENKKIKI